MFDIKFKINDRNIRPDQIGKELERAALADVKEQVHRKASSIRCPVHGTTARVTAKGQDLHRLSWTVEGCCDELIERVKKAMS